MVEMTDSRRSSTRWSSLSSEDECEEVELRARDAIRASASPSRRRASRRSSSQLSKGLELELGFLEGEVVIGSGGVLCGGVRARGFGLEAIQGRSGWTSGRYARL